MVPIFLSGKAGRKEYEFDDFANRFVEICKDHRRQGCALAFACILYDFNNAHTVKVLTDSDYWRALNEISGSFLTVFSFHVDEQSLRGARRGGKSMAIVKSTDAGRHRMAKFLRTQFGAAALINYPIILFFQVDDQAVSDTFLVKFADNGKESVFNEVRSVLQDAVDSVSEVEPQFRENTAEIFALITARLQQRYGSKVVRSVVKLVVDLRSLFS